MNDEQRRELYMSTNKSISAIIEGSNRSQAAEELFARLRQSEKRAAVEGWIDEKELDSKIKGDYPKG